MNLRDYRDSDAEPLAELFTCSINTLAAAHYDAAQRAAWAPTPPDIAEWRQRFRGLSTLVAEQDDRPVGFLSYEADGHIDLLYRAPDANSRGVAAALLQKATSRLQASGVRQLHTEASLVAMPFFRRHGFEIIEEQNVFRRGVGFRRFLMSRTLA